MRNLKVVEIQSEGIIFDDGSRLHSEHEQDCCEHHYLSFRDLTLKDFEGMLFNLDNDLFFNRIAGYGIELIPIVGHPVRVAGYGGNNGYYSDQLNLVVEKSDGTGKTFDITACQVVDG